MPAKKKPARKLAKKPVKKAVKKAPAKKAVKKAPAKKKTAIKKAPPKKAPAKKAAPPKPVTKKAAPPKPVVKKAVVRPPAPVVETVVVTAAVEVDDAPVFVADLPPKPRPEPVNDTAVLPGDPAPDFQLFGDDDAPVKLSDLRGRNVVLYFYPRDNTPGCTLEGRDFSALQNEFEAKNAVILGVSTDDLNAHRRFKSTCDLTVRLLSDPAAVVHQAYGVWREKNMYGQKRMGTQRATFLIDEAGRIKRVWPKVSVEDHALDVLNAL